MLMILGRASGFVERAAIIEFGWRNLKAFRRLGMLKRGVPSEATLCRVESGIDDLAMSDRMRGLVETLRSALLKGLRGKETICVDGKAMRGTAMADGRSPDIVSAYSSNAGVILAAEACGQKSNEITAVPRLLDKIDISGKVVTADAMALQKHIIDTIRRKGGDFVIELKANQRSLRCRVEDTLKLSTPASTHTVGPELGHGRIETRTYRIYDGRGIIVDKEKWGGSMTIIEYESHTIRKRTGDTVSERRLYVSSLPATSPSLGALVRSHWSIESMHWGLDVNLQQDRIRRKSPKAARNLDTVQRVVYSVLSAWRGLRKNKADKRKGIAEIMRHASMSFTRLLKLLCQKIKK